MALVPESLDDNNYADFGLEATQLSQPVNHSQPSGSQYPNSQIEPRRKYWAVFIPTNPQHAILKLPWSKPRVQIGRGNTPQVGNDVILAEKRVSNRHCVISLDVKGKDKADASQRDLIEAMRDEEDEPGVWIEDLKSSNGTFLNGKKLTTRRMVTHGDEISLGHSGTAENHEVRYIFRSVGTKSGRRNDGGVVVGEVYERYQMLQSLGKGTFAEVKKAVDVETGDMRAIKQIVKHRFSHDPKTLELFQREIDICTQLAHENICRLLEWFEDPQHICLVLEYVDGGDMLDYIMKYPAPELPEDEAIDFTFQICRAMAYCHENGVTHRDLKPENILLTNESESQARIVKIADFGLAKMINNDGTMLKSLVGTPQYLAPEVVMQTKAKPGYENVVDSWSVGIIVYSMLTKSLPFDDDDENTLEQRIRARATMDFDRNELALHKVSPQAIDFIERLLEPDPSKRMTMAQALEHEWLAGPSSLPNESQSQPLGGDSMWNIQSFESAWADETKSEDGSMDMDGATTTGSNWSRPMTVSMTNFDSAGVGGSSSSDSFSQPLEKLRLSTAREGFNTLSPTREEATASPAPDGDNEAGDENVPPPPANGLGSPMDIDKTSTATIGKRKLLARPASEAFSSGSLSPAPDSQPKAATPKARGRANGAGAEGERARETTPRAAAQPTSGGRVTRASTARVAATQGSPASRTRSRAANGTKSRRLG